MLIQREFDKLKGYNIEVTHFLVDALTKDQHKEITITEILKVHGLGLNTFLVPEDFDILL